jgi:hypothetical protein
MLKSMTLNEFIQHHDTPGSIVLLEGKRIVPENGQDKLVKLGTLLTQMTKHMLVRSGNASGADFYFSSGVAAVDVNRLQLIVPYSGYRKKKGASYNTISLDDVSLAYEPEVVYQSRENKKTEKLIDQYLSGNRDRFAIKAAYILRDTMKAIGTKNVPPASFGIFYDDLSNPQQGTQAIR